MYVMQVQYCAFKTSRYLNTFLYLTFITLNYFKAMSIYDLSFLVFLTTGSISKKIIVLICTCLPMYIHE